MVDYETLLNGLVWVLGVLGTAGISGLVIAIRIQREAYKWSIEFSVKEAMNSQKELIAHGYSVQSIEANKYHGKPVETEQPKPEVIKDISPKDTLIAYANHSSEVVTEVSDVKYEYSLIRADMKTIQDSLKNLSETLNDYMENPRKCAECPLLGKEEEFEYNEEFPTYLASGVSITGSEKQLKYQVTCNICNATHWNTDAHAH